MLYNGERSEVGAIALRLKSVAQKEMQRLGLTGTAGASPPHLRAPLGAGVDRVGSCAAVLLRPWVRCVPQCPPQSGAIRLL